jgi:hypothetical protein
MDENKRNIIEHLWHISRVEKSLGTVIQAIGGLQRNDLYALEQLVSHKTKITIYSLILF